MLGKLIATSVAAGALAVAALPADAHGYVSVGIAVPPVVVAGPAYPYGYGYGPAVVASPYYGYGGYYGYYGPRYGYYHGGYGYRGGYAYRGGYHGGYRR